MLVVAAVDSNQIHPPVSGNDWTEYFLKNGNRYELSGVVVGTREAKGGPTPKDGVPLPQRLSEIREQLLVNFLDALVRFCTLPKPLGME